MFPDHFDVKDPSYKTLALRNADHVSTKSPECLYGFEFSSFFILGFKIFSEIVSSTEDKFPKHKI
jgi:hypothetical protein